MRKTCCKRSTLSLGKIILCPNGSIMPCLIPPLLPGIIGIMFDITCHFFFRQIAYRSFMHFIFPMHLIYREKAQHLIRLKNAMLIGKSKGMYFTLNAVLLLCFCCHCFFYSTAKIIIHSFICIKIQHPFSFYML